MRRIEDRKQLSELAHRGRVEIIGSKVLEYKTIAPKFASCITNHLLHFVISATIIALVIAFVGIPKRVWRYIYRSFCSFCKRNSEHQHCFANNINGTYIIISKQIYTDSIAVIAVIPKRLLIRNYSLFIKPLDK